ncbi:MULTISPECIES: hypothetical protein [Streptomyces]|uniref:hypothetical protein n=1 Tax=Streptomyces TaxID=1883 RepID=UPI000765802F|nr:MULTISPECIES: hypothetical protein [Streptomyces]WUB58920.1 hypothetical protein OG942_44280 [Streptomyces griseorubiginosus]
MSTENPANSRPQSEALSESEAAAEARRIIEGLWRSEPTAKATSFVDPTPNPPYGTAAPVHQDDRRIVPAWAAGVAVASIGVGAGITGIGCGVWLACQGFAAVTLTSVLFVTLPIAAVATVVVAVGSAIRGVKAANNETHHHYDGATVHQKNTSVSDHPKWFGRSNTTVNN